MKSLTLHTQVAYGNVLNSSPVYLIRRGDPGKCRSNKNKTKFNHKEVKFQSTEDTASVSKGRQNDAILSPDGTGRPLLNR